jgi:hypothetical protein
MPETLYTVNGEVLNEALNWTRYCRVRIFEHTQVVADPSDPYYNQTFAQAAEGDVILDISTLRVKFEVKRFAMFYPNTALISIYNLQPSAENAVIFNGYRITLTAGYADNLGQIFDGNIIQCTRWKENGTDYILQILALDGHQFINQGFCSFTYTKGMTARDLVKKLAAATSPPITVAYASAELDKIKLSKGMAVDGLTRNYLSDLSKTINGTWFVDNGQLYVVSYADDSSLLPQGKQAIELSEKTGLLGNPKQNQQGVVATALLNPQFMPFGFVHIRNELITAQLVTIQSYAQPPSFPYALDVAGLYRIISVVFRGDTRGESQSWTAELTTVSQAGNIPEILMGTGATYN